MALDIDALTSSLSRWEISGYLAIGIVAVGCLGESICDFTDWTTKDTKKWLGKASALVLIFGLACEGVAQVKANSISAQIVASLENETAHANAEQARLKQLVVWRSIPDDELSNLTAKFSAKKATVLLSIEANDPEAMMYGSQISKAFTGAGWTVIPQSASWGNWLPIGVHVYGTDNDLVKLVQDSFSADGIQFTNIPPPRKPDMSIDFDQKSPAPGVTILVGSRIGPF